MTKRSKCISYLFVVLMLLVLLSTTLYDKSINNGFPNTAMYCAGGYFVISAAILLVVRKVFHKFSTHDISRNAYIIIFIVAGVLLSALAIAISMWVPEYFKADFGACRKKAIELAGGGIFAGDQYFITYKNNVNITLLFSFIYGIFKDWRAVIVIGALCTVVSSLLASQIVLKVTNSYLFSLLSLIICGVMMLLEWRSYIPYSDNYGMLFGVLLVYLLVVDVNKNIKIPLVFLVFMVGKWIKPTVSIVFLAIIIYYFLINDAKSIKNHVLSMDLRVVIPALAIIFIVSSILNGRIYDKFEYETDDTTYGASHWLLIGADGTNCGTYRGELYGEAAENIDEQYSKADERSREYIKLSLQWYKERGIGGNIRFMMEKLDAAYNDGKFNDVQNYDKKEDVEQNLFYEIFIKKGAFYPQLTESLQILWFFILCCIMCGTFSGTKEKNELPDCQLLSLFELIILGVTAYIMVFENRSKYLFMFLPIYITFAILHLYRNTKAKE